MKPGTVTYALTICWPDAPDGSSRTVSAEQGVPFEEAAERLEVLVDELRAAAKRQDESCPR